MASSTRSSSTSHARTCCVIIWARANSVCMSNSPCNGMLLILPETAARSVSVSARNQSSHRLSLWLMSHGRLRRSRYPAGGAWMLRTIRCTNNNRIRLGMSILGLICVLLALVATLLLVLFLFPAARSAGGLAVVVDRATRDRGERLPSAHRDRAAVTKASSTCRRIGVSVNQLLPRAARTSGRENPARSSSPSSASASTKRCSCIATSSCTRTASSRVSSASIASTSSTAGSPTWSRPNTRSWSPRTCAAACWARTAPTASRSRWSACRAR